MPKKQDIPPELLIVHNGGLSTYSPWHSPYAFNSEKRHTSQETLLPLCTPSFQESSSIGVNLLWYYRTVRSLRCTFQPETRLSNKRGTYNSAIYRSNFRNVPVLASPMLFIIEVRRQCQPPMFPRMQVSNGSPCSESNARPASSDRRVLLAKSVATAVNTVGNHAGYRFRPFETTGGLITAERAFDVDRKSVV